MSHRMGLQLPGVGKVTRPLTSPTVSPCCRFLSQKLSKIKALAGTAVLTLSQPMGCAWARCQPTSQCQPRQDPT